VEDYFEDEKEEEQQQQQQQASALVTTTNTGQKITNPPALPSAFFPWPKKGHTVR
jgi:hypothetical protein